MTSFGIEAGEHALHFLAIRNVHGGALPALHLVAACRELADQLHAQLPGTTEDRRPARHKKRA